MAKTCNRAPKTDIGGEGEAEAMHCTRVSIYTELPINCLSFWVMQRTLSQIFPGPTSRATPGEAERRRTPGVEALKMQRQICEVGRVESHTWD